MSRASFFFFVFCVVAVACSAPPPEVVVVAPVVPVVVVDAGVAAVVDAGVVEVCFPTTVPLDQLRLRAITPPTATVETPDGGRHEIKVGTMVGRQLGQVTAIRKDAVVVVEEVRDAEGRRVQREVLLRP